MLETGTGAFGQVGRLLLQCLCACASDVLVADDGELKAGVLQVPTDTWKVHDWQKQHDGKGATPGRSVQEAQGCVEASG